MQAPGPLHALELGFDTAHALLNKAAIGLDLCFARAAEEAEAAALAFEMGPRADQPRLLISQMGQLDLERAFPRSRPTAENLQDQSGPIDNFCRKGLFEIALLNRRKGAIHDDKINVFRARLIGNLGDFAFAQEGRRMNLSEEDIFFCDDLEIDCFSQAFGLR